MQKKEKHISVKNVNKEDFASIPVFLNILYQTI